MTQSVQVAIFPFGITAEERMTPKEIGRIVRTARRAQGLRQDQLAGAAGVGVRFLSEFERGKPTVRLEKMIAVLETLGCTIRIEMPPGDAVSDREAAEGPVVPGGGPPRRNWSSE